MPKAQFTAKIEFDYTDELDYAETIRDIIERGRELSSFEIDGEVKRTRDDGSPVGRQRHVYRVSYGGVFDATVEVVDRVIISVLSVRANQLPGHKITSLPEPNYYESKLLASEKPVRD